MWFDGMEGSILGMWSAHGEGKFEFPKPEMRRECEKQVQHPTP